MIQEFGIDILYPNSGYHQHPAEGAVPIAIGDYNHQVSSSEWQVFTDSAKNEAGTGAAFVIFNSSSKEPSKEEYHKLEAHCSNNQAELWAMHAALLSITSNLAKIQGRINFFTDSRYVLSVLKGTTKRTAVGEKTLHLARNLHKRRDIKFYWIPGHSGIHGNERADCLAKKATALQTSPSFRKIPLTFISKALMDITIADWQENWKNSTTGRLTFRFIPSIIKRQHLSHLRISHEITQGLTGHGNFPAYLHRFKKSEKDTCSCDNTTTGDALHMILDCPTYDVKRQSLIGYCLLKGQNWPPNLDFLCTDKGAFKHLSTLLSFSLKSST
ncbi:uncharacterized protein [Centruroides vittatus]|uniref:uncharacterized protein n=1 Tax=Centruroides vittatus TaxID=120091 RepID=UPI00350F599D